MCQLSRSRVQLKELEATWHAALEDALRVVYSAHLLQPLLSPPLAEYVLPCMRIVEVTVARLHIFCSGSNVNIIDKFQANGLDCGSIVRIFPGTCELGHHDRLDVAGKGRYCVLQNGDCAITRGTIGWKDTDQTIPEYPRTESQERCQISYV